jgi:hypothetical protein
VRVIGCSVISFSQKNGAIIAPSYDASEMNGQTVTIDGDYVGKHLDVLVADEDLSRVFGRRLSSQALVRVIGCSVISFSQKNGAIIAPPHLL